MGVAAHLPDLDLTQARPSGNCLWAERLAVDDPALVAVDFATVEAEVSRLAGVARVEPLLLRELGRNPAVVALIANDSELHHPRGRSIAEAVHECDLVADHVLREVDD